MAEERHPYRISRRNDLVPGPEGLDERSCSQITFYNAILGELASLDPYTIKVLIALALNARSPDAREFQQLREIGVVGERDRGKLLCVLEKAQLCRLTGLNPKTVDRRCQELLERGWVLRIVRLPQGRRLGRFAGGTVYLMAAAEREVPTERSALAELLEGILQERQRDDAAPPVCGTDGSPYQRHPVPEGAAPHTDGTPHRRCPMPGGAVPRTAGGTPMETWETEREGKGERQQQPGAIAPVVPDPGDRFQQDGLSLAMLDVLDHFAREVTLRGPGGGQGQTSLPEGYEVSRAVLRSAPPFPESLLREATARVVEEDLLLAWNLWSHTPARLKEAVDRALGQAGEDPVPRLSIVWPGVPGAIELKDELERIHSRGAELPGGDGFRDALRLFVLLNQFKVGPPLAAQFLGLCAELGVRPMHAALKRAARHGRAYVTLRFLQDAVEREGDHGAPWPVRGDHGTAEDDVGPPGDDAEEDASQDDARTLGRPSLAGARGASSARTTRVVLEEYGITSPALDRLADSDPRLAWAWLLYLEDQELDQQVKRGILINRLRGRDPPPAVYLALAGLTEEQTAWLERQYTCRRWMGRWQEDPESEGIMIDTAEAWYRARRGREG